MCGDCNQTIHSLGSFTEHDVIELATVEDPKTDIPLIDSLEICPIHGEKIEFYEEEESLEESQEFEFASVTYGCWKCNRESGSQFSKIDKNNLLNVYQLK